jgi:tetratricopeptide (TPR) repeat protein
MASIVRHCVDPDPSRRYQTARELQEDLHRQLDNLPLRHAFDPSLRERAGKWARRHPRLTSSTSVGLVAAVLLLALGATFLVRNRHFQSLEAATAYRWLGDERKEAIAFLTMPAIDRGQIEEGLLHCRRAVDRYGVLDDPNWSDRSLAASLPPADRARLRQDLGDLLLLWAQTLMDRSSGSEGDARVRTLNEAADRLDRAASCFGPEASPRALLLARADLERARVGDTETQRQLRARALSMPLPADPRRVLLEDPKLIDSDLRSRLVPQLEAIAEDARDWATWVSLGNWNLRLRRPREAQSAYDIAVSLAPRSWLPRYNRALLSLELKDPSRAHDDLDRVIALRPDLSAAYLNRALARLEFGDASGAVNDLTTSLSLKGASSRAWFIRAVAKQRLGDLAGARLDREEGLRHEPPDPAGFIARGLARLPANPQAALADFDAALAIEPTNAEALQDKASVLGETMGKADEALRVLDTLLLHHPDRVQAICGRGVQLARLGRFDAALRDARAALALDHASLTHYQVACIYAQLTKQQPSCLQEALGHLSDSIRQDGNWLATARVDHDLDMIRTQTAFQELLQASEVLLRARGR